MRSLVPTTDYARYAAAWDQVAYTGYHQFNVDTWAAGHRYLSLTALALTSTELNQLRELTWRFSRLVDCAVEAILADADWWSALAWPWAAIELARQEPAHPGGRATLFGRFDYLLERATGDWQLIEYNADTPSGGRELCGLEPAIAGLHGLACIEHRFPSQLVRTLVERMRAHERSVRIVGVVSMHRWLEDLSQAVWLAALLERAGIVSVVGDVQDLEARGGRIVLRGQAIDALYRFYPLERLYRHAIFASVFEAAIDRRLLLLNGLRGFLAQSKACLAWLWANRQRFGREDRAAIERHLPATWLVRDPDAPRALATSVVKHVNGREGDSVMFGEHLDAAGWEARLLEGGYVVQRAVESVSVEDVEVDEWRREVRVTPGRVACVGGFSVGERFAGCYTRLDGPITSARATYVATLREV